MKFEELLKRWTESEMVVASYRLCHPCRGRRPEVDFICTQLKRVADHWYAELVAEVARERRQLPRI